MKRRRHSDPLGRMKDFGPARDRSTAPCLGCRSGASTWCPPGRHTPDHLTVVLSGPAWPESRPLTGRRPPPVDRVRRIGSAVSSRYPFGGRRQGPGPVSMSGAKRWRGEWQ